MIGPYKEILNDNCYVLEPSVGKGDIAKFIKDLNYHKDRVRIHGIEPEPELADLAKKYCQIVGSDFLDFESDTDYDLIIMNPPFDRGDEHLIKAWEILRN
jgi:tRNA1(Val) A37 N6-methylase TrmN6